MTWLCDYLLAVRNNSNVHFAMIYHIQFTHLVNMHDRDSLFFDFNISSRSFVAIEISCEPVSMHSVHCLLYRSNSRNLFTNLSLGNAIDSFVCRSYLHIF